MNILSYPNKLLKTSSLNFSILIRSHTVTPLFVKCTLLENIYLLLPHFHIPSFFPMPLIKLSPLPVYWNSSQIPHYKRSKGCFHFRWFLLGGTMPVPWLLPGIPSLKLYPEKQAFPKGLSWHVLLAEQLGTWIVGPHSLRFNSKSATMSCAILPNVFILFIPVKWW